MAKEAGTEDGKSIRSFIRTQWKTICGNALSRFISFTSSYQRLALRYKWGAANVHGFSVARTHSPLESATNGEQFSGQLSAYLLKTRLFSPVSYNHFLGHSQKIHFEV